MLIFKLYHYLWIGGTYDCTVYVLGTAQRGHLLALKDKHLGEPNS